MTRDRANCLDYCDQPSYHHVDDLGILLEVIGPHIKFSFTMLIGGTGLYSDGREKR